MKFFFVCLVSLISSNAFSQIANESELGFASANGNTKTLSLTFKQANDYKWDSNVLGFKLRYLNAKANGVENARYFMSGLRYEREVSHQFGIFTGETYEKDKFAGIDKRLSTDLGGKYRIIATDMTKLFTEAGYRYLHEERTNSTFAYSHHLRGYGEWENKWNPNFSTKYWIEYLPNLTESTDWQLNSELSLSAVLSTVFSLKTSGLVRYDNLPAPGIIHKTESLISSALVAKY